MTFNEDYLLAIDDTFKQQVTMASQKTAAAVAAEDPSNTYHDQRQAFGTQCMRNPVTMGATVAFSVAAQPGITTGATDGDIEFTVNALWNALAGVSAYVTP